MTERIGGTAVGGGWRGQGACRRVEDPDVFFSERETSIELALVLCRACPVLVACRRYALRMPERFGIWGGTTPADRELLLTLHRSIGDRSRTPLRSEATRIGA